MYDYRIINKEVMIDTQQKYQTLPALKEAVRNSIDHQYLVKHEDVVQHKPVNQSKTRYVVSPKRSLEAASNYSGKKVAVLSFANNHTVGGDPFSSGAQEESICRCSTLYPCLQSEWKAFYERHQNLYNSGVIDHVGNDDIIYTPDVVVFKSDERTDPICPQMMPQDKWFKVDIITCASPELRRGSEPANYDAIISSRISKILDVAANEHVEVLILGAWGCGAFRNPVEKIANTFHNLLRKYEFETVEFAISSEGPFYDVFKETFSDVLTDNMNQNIISDTMNSDTGTDGRSVDDTIECLLRDTGREGIETMIKWMWSNSYFEAPASRDKHNAFKGGLAKHSLDVFYEAMKLEESKNLPWTSIAICTLLHDVCKSDQYYVDSEGKAQRIEANIRKGHGLRSLFIITRLGKLPLNYDEALAIWWHMGENEASLKYHTKEYERFYKESLSNDLCKLIRKADGIASGKEQ